MDAIISQLEIYDQIWYVRHMPSEGKHSMEATKIAADMVKILETVLDGGTECFPFDTIAVLKKEYRLG